MTNLTDKIMRLSPEKRANLLNKLKQYGQAEDTSIPQLQKRTTKGPVSASFQQEQLWFIDVLSEGSARNNVANLLTFKGPLDIKALEWALGQLVIKHEVLRTGIKKQNDEILQEIYLQHQYSLKQIDLSSLSAEEKDNEYKSHEDKLIHTKFDLSQPPLFQATLFIMGQDEYNLLWVVHHIAWDASSLKAFLDDLKAFYLNYTSSQKTSSPELDIQYADYAVWQRKMMQGSQLEKLKKFWKTELHNMEAMEVLSDYPRPKKATYEGKRISLEIENDMLSKLKEICVANNLTFFIAMLSVFKVLMHYYTGKEDIVVGTPTANRQDVALEGLVGFFVNMVVLRNIIEPSMTFRDFLLEVRAKVLLSFENQQLPFEKVVECVNPSREIGRHPLFQIEFTTESINFEHQKLTDEITIETHIIHDNAARFDLSFIANEFADKILITLEYNTQLYHPSTIQNMLENFKHLLHIFVTNPDLKIGDIAPNSPRNGQYLIEKIAKGTYRDIPQNNIVSLFEEQVKKHKDKIAITFGETQLTYEQLNEKADKVAAHLMQAGIKTESRIGILLDRSAEMVITLLGILKVGAVYVPLEKEYPKDRIEQIIHAANLKAIISDSDLPAFLINDSGVSEFDLLDILEILKKPTAIQKSPENIILPSNLAYIIFTSGSTGVPKGVMISHEAVVSFITSINRAYEITDQDRIIQFASISFDVSVFDIFSALLSGAQLVIASQEERRDHEKLRDLMQNNNVTVAELPPAILPLLNSNDYPDLRLLSVGGELPSAEIINAWGGDRIRVVNGYGPTETTVAVTLMDCKAPLVMSPPIGRPIDNHAAYVVNTQFELVPWGAAGELVISGPGLARGYCNSARITAEKFIPNPFSDKEGDRLYRTGDLVKWLPDGNLQFLGRIDRQVKIRGHRIELGEIESVLNKLPDVTQAVVEVFTNEQGQKILQAVMVGKVDTAHLRSALRGVLPDYMIPNSFTLLDKIPVTTNGKIDYKALISHCDIQAKQPEIEKALDETDLKLINEIFVTVLRKDAIKLTDNFFEIGGNSIQATQIVSRIRSTFGIDLSLAQFFEFTSIHEISEYLKARLAAKSNEEQDILTVLYQIEAMSNAQVGHLLHKNAPIT